MVGAGGFADPPALTPVEARQQGPETARRLLKGIQELGTQAAHRLQGSPDLPESKAAETSKARLSSGGAASESDPGSRDFSLNGSKAEGLSQEGIQSMASTSGQSGSYRLLEQKTSVQTNRTCLIPQYHENNLKAVRLCNKIECRKNQVVIATWKSLSKIRSIARCRS